MHIFSNRIKNVSYLNVHIRFFYAHFQNLCASWHFHPAFFLCDNPKCALKIDGWKRSFCVSRCVCVCECVCVCKCHIYWHNVFSGLFSGFSNTPINKSVILSILKYLYCTLSLTILSIPLCVCAEACFGQIKSVPFGEAIANFTFYESPTHSLSTFI